MRDLGGLPAGDGRSTVHGRLVRAEFTDLIVAADVDQLVHRVGLRTVVDIRRPSETRYESVAWADHGVTWHNCPFGLGKGAAVATGGADFTSVYLGYLETDPGPVVQAVETLLERDNHPAMFHCAAGKDRTGVLSALLLDVLGILPEAIAADYAMSAENIEPVLARLAAQPPYERMLAGYTLEEHIPDPEVMLAFLRRLDESCGGAEGWLTGHGVDAALLERFRAAMLA